MRLYFAVLFVPFFVTSCGTITLPAAVKMDAGEVLIGTTTASPNGGLFEVSSPDNATTCSGTYNPYDTAPILEAPFKCSDGRFGNVVVSRSANGMEGTGLVNLSDGSSGRVAFGSSASRVLSEPSVASLAAPSYGQNPTFGSSAVSAPRTYSGNCPTPDSIAADGKRCGARSAASRPGGYSGYRVTSSRSYRGSTYVRGHYRSGHYVRGHYRRR
ncbi:hypothetical protein EXN61_21725 [Agrobacterium tumefaciens]|uniref:Lipoprotein n=1 Tax=Agrobacterium tumefaciens TaxID=358 RepID=A0A546XRV6_AGRTU|nr:hypothetical protein EXN61_21725 [Agrobacterium tumefaciens]